MNTRSPVLAVHISLLRFPGYISERLATFMAIGSDSERSRFCSRSAHLYRPVMFVYARLHRLLAMPLWLF